MQGVPRERRTNYNAGWCQNAPSPWLDGSRSAHATGLGLLANPFSPQVPRAEPAIPIATMSSLPIGTDDAGNQEAELLAQFARNLKVPLLNTMTHALQDVAPIEGLSPAFLRSNSLLPFSVSDEVVHIASSVPVQLAALDALKQFFSVPTRLHLAPRMWIHSGLDQIYRPENANLAAFDDENASGSDNQDDDLETLKALAEDAPVVRLVQSLLLRAVESRASDLHLEVSQQKFRVRYRIDGVLFDAESPPGACTWRPSRT